MFTMADEMGGMRKAVLGVAICVLAVILVLACSLLSIFLVYSIRAGKKSDNDTL